MYWPILLAVASDVVYQIAAKSTPHDLNPFASLTITYLIGAAASAIIYFIMSRGGNIFHEWGQINWAVFILGIAIVGLEAGAIYMYRAGWNINTGRHASSPWPCSSWDICSTEKNSVSPKSQASSSA